MVDLEKDPLEYRKKRSQPGARAPIFYTPYRRFAEFARDFIERLPRSATSADPGYAIYLDYLTAIPGVIMPRKLRDENPFQIKIVLQHQFENLTAFRDKFTVVLWFGGRPETLAIPYDAVREIVVPAVGIRLENFGLPSLAIKDQN